jgi:hypothetical protein
MRSEGTDRLEARALLLSRWCARRRSLTYGPGECLSSDGSCQRACAGGGEVIVGLAPSLYPRKIGSGKRRDVPSSNSSSRQPAG